MKRLLASLCATLLLTTLAFGANPQFKKGDPDFFEQGLVLLMTGKLTGLSNADVLITISAVGVPVVTCMTHGGNTSPGQNPGETQVEGSVSIPAADVQNGQLTVALTTQPPPNPDSSVSCPNKNWVAFNESMDFTSVTVTVSQNNVVVIEETFAL